MKIKNTETAFDAIRKIMDESNIPSETYVRIDYVLNQIQEAHGREVDRLKGIARILPVGRYPTKDEFDVANCDYALHIHVGGNVPRYTKAFNNSKGRTLGLLNVPTFHDIPDMEAIIQALMDKKDAAKKGAVQKGWATT